MPADLLFRDSAPELPLRTALLSVYEGRLLTANRRCCAPFASNTASVWSSSLPSARLPRTLVQSTIGFPLGPGVCRRLRTAARPGGGASRADPGPDVVEEHSEHLP